MINKILNHIDNNSKLEIGQITLFRKGNLVLYKIQNSDEDYKLLNINSQLYENLLYMLSNNI